MTAIPIYGDVQKNGEDEIQAVLIGDIQSFVQPIQSLFFQSDNIN